MSALAKVIKGNLKRFVACGMLLRAYHRANMKYPVDAKIGGPYAICGLHAALLNRRCARVWGIDPDEVEIFFDNPGKHKGGLTVIFNKMGLEGPVFRSSKKLTGVQAADFIAWEHRRLLEDVAKETGRAIGRSMRVLNSIPGDSPVYGESAVIRLCKELGVAPRK